MKGKKVKERKVKGKTNRYQGGSIERVKGIMTKLKSRGFKRQGLEGKGVKVQDLKRKI